MGPVGPPQDPVGADFQQRLSEGYCIGKRRACRGNPLSAADFHPARLPARGIQKQAERLLLQARSRRYAAHMVDDERHRKAIQQGLVLQQVGSIEMQHYMPAQRLDPVYDPVKNRHVGRPAQMLDEIEPHTANPALVKLFQRPVVEGPVHVGHAAIEPAALGDGVKDDRIVDAVATGVDQHRALQPKRRLQFPEPFQGRVGRRVFSTRGVGVNGSRTEDMAMGVASSRGRNVVRLAGIGVRGSAGGNRHGAVCYQHSGPRTQGASPGKRAPYAANTTTTHKRELRFPETAVPLAGVKSALARVRTGMMEWRNLDG